jgi:pimeloyl-ACP methyl ester carboxylesterase
MPKANLADVEIYYEEQGEGEPIVLVPASWWPSDAWNVGVVPLLSQRYRTIVFDCRGTGRSSKPDGGYTVPQFAEDCLRLLAHLGVPRCHAVGFALGGQIVQAMAIERPDLVATLTMAASGPGAKTLSGGPRIVSPDTEREIRDMGFERYIRAYIENDTMAFNPKFYQERGDAVKALADAVWSGQSTVELFRRHEDARLTWDSLAKAVEVKVPTLILCGADDDVRRRGSTPVDTAKRLAELTPGSELVLIPQVKHMTFWDGNGGLDALQEFLARHPIEPGFRSWG